MAERKPYVGKRVAFVASDYGDVQRAGELKDLADMMPSGAGLAGTVLPSGTSTLATPNLTGGTTIKPTPALQQTARQIMADPKAFVQRSPAEPGNVGFLDRGKDLLGRIFDYEDKADLSIGPVNLSGVESVWDGFLRSFDWFYDRLNQLSTAAISALPGGTRTLTYDEAGQVSFGQEFVANAGISAGRIRRGEGNLGDITAAASLPGLAGLIFGADSPIQQPGFDITSEADRKAFESGSEKFFSGMTDTFFTLFADPLIFGGKAAKLTKLRYLTKPLNSAARQEEFVRNLDEGVAAIVAGTTPVAQVAPEAQFLYWAVGGKDNVRKAPEILSRAEIQDQGMEGVALALELIPRTLPEAERLQLGRDVMAAAFDAGAKQRLTDRLPIAASAIANAERYKISLQLASDPGEIVGLRASYRKQLDDAETVLRTLQEDNRRLLEGFADPNVRPDKISGVATGAAVAEAQQRYDELLVTVNALDNGTLPDPAMFAKNGQAYDQVLQDATNTNNALRAAIIAAERTVHPSETYGFAADNAFGRFVTGSRARRAEASYQYKSTYAAKEVTHTDFFGNSRFVNTIRVWRWPGVLRPSGYVVIDGINDVDGVTEVNSLLDSLAFLGGQPKKIQVPIMRENTVTKKMEPVLDKNGVPRTEERLVGGVPAKQRLMTEFMTNYGVNYQMGSAVQFLEKGIRDEMEAFYGLRSDILDTVIGKAFATRAQVTADMVEKGRKFFAEMEKGSDLAVLHKAPHLESQLRNGMYMLPYDAMEKIVRKYEKRVQKGDPSIEGAIFNWQTTLVAKGSDALNIFYDFWRPAVLFRLGYPQRNVAEGVFRSMAFLASVSPLKWAGQGLAYGSTNIGRQKRVARRIESLRQQMGKPDVSRDQFDEVVTQQKTLRELQFALIRKAKEYRNPGSQIPDSVSFENMLIDRDGMLSTADNGIQIVRERNAAGEERWVVYQRAEKGGADIDGNPIPIPVPGLPDFASPTLAVRALDTMVNDMLADFKATGQPTAAARKFMKEPGSFIGEILRTGFPKVPDPIEVDAALIGMAPDVSEQVTKTVQVSTKKIATGRYETTDGRFRIHKAEDEQGQGWSLFEVVPDPSGGTRLEWWNTFPSKKAALQAVRDEISQSAAGTGLISKSRTLASLEEVEAAIAKTEKNIDALEAKIKDFGGRPISAALKNSKFEKWRAGQLVALDEQIAESRAWIDSAREMVPTGQLTERQQEILIYERDRIRDLENQRVALERDDVYALNQYGGQAAAKRRVDNGSNMTFTPGVVLHSAFGNPKFKDIAWSEASSDNTVRATLSLRMDFMESAIYRKDMETYREVTPDMGEKYWLGMEDYLRQFHFDPLGQKILAGETVEDMAKWLLGTKQGRELRDSIDQVNKARNPDERDALFIGNNVAQAQAWINRIATGFYAITLNNASIATTMRTRPVTAAELKAALEGSEGLIPVVGHTDEISGRKTFMQTWRTLTGRAFRLIGTLPEDSLVRGPFYSKRYDQARAQIVSMLDAKYAGRENIPMSEVLQLEGRAHRTALRDTKKYLYTIDRRTNLATYGEHVLPFITATQNSVTTLGRLTYKDPSLPGILLALWSAPTRVGWEDQDGNIRIPLPEPLIPDGVERFFGIEGYDNLMINKDSLNVIFPESGFAFVPRPTPLVQVTASELMKNGFFGLFTVEAPDVLVKFMGRKDADAIWKYWKNYIFGEESAISPEFLSYDKITPPTFNRILQLIQGDSSNQYAYQYGLQARTLDLMWRAGQLDEYPTADEIARRTNGMFLLRFLGNAFAFTPPTYESPVDQLIQMQREYDRVFGILGPQKFSENFGNETLILSSTETATNVGGTTVTTDTVRNINRYEGLIMSLATQTGDDLSVLGILVNPDPGESEYDTNAYRWMTTSNIPGTTRKWREINSGQEAMYEAQRQAGWVEYIKFKNSLDAMLQQRGLSSYRVKDAADLNLLRKQFIDNMMDNPLYEGWKNDFLTPGSTKTRSALKVISAALQDEKFMQDHQDDKTWWMATQYIAARQQVVDYIKASGEPATSPANEQVLMEWDAYRQDLMNQDIGWASIANRYLLSDDEPDDLGISF